MNDKETTSPEQQIRSGWLPEGSEVTLTAEIQGAWVWKNPTYLQWWIDLQLLAGSHELEVNFDADGSVHLCLGAVEFNQWTLAYRWSVGVGFVAAFLTLLCDPQLSPATWQTIRIKSNLR